MFSCTFPTLASLKTFKTRAGRRSFSFARERKREKNATKMRNYKLLLPRGKLKRQTIPPYPNLFWCLVFI